MLAAALLVATAASAEPLEPGAQPAPAHRIAFFGDILLGADGRKVLRDHPEDWPFAQVRMLIERADTRIGNAEGPITERARPHFRKQRWHYAAPPYQAAVLAKLGFHALGLANNHALDRGPEGIRDTYRFLKDAGVAPFGAGGDLDEARRPFAFETPHGRVAVIGLGKDASRRLAATRKRAGIHELSFENARFAAQRAREDGARWLVAYVHWGENYQDVVPEQRDAAKFLAELGYDLVVGHHAHVVQGAERIAGRFVFYSLGNFVFTTKGRFTEQQPGRGLILTAELGPRGFSRFELACLVTDNRTVSYQPRACSASEASLLWTRLGAPFVAHGERAEILVDSPS